MGKRKKGEPLPPPSPPPLMVRLQYLESFKELSYEALGRLFMALMEYAISCDHSVTLGSEKLLFPMLKRDRDEDAAKWLEKVETSRINGAKGGRPPKNKDGNSTADDEEPEDGETQENPLGFSETQKTPYTITDTSSTPLSFPFSNTLASESDRSSTAGCNYLTNYDELTQTTDYARTYIQGFTESNAQEIVNLMTRGNTMSGELIRYAINEACAFDKVDGWGYVHNILKRYQNQGLKTLDDAKADHNTFSKAKRDAVTGRSKTKKAQAEPEKPKYNFVT